MALLGGVRGDIIIQTASGSLLMLSRFARWQDVPEAGGTKLQRGPRHVRASKQHSVVQSDTQ